MSDYELDLDATRAQGDPMPPERRFREMPLADPFDGTPSEALKAGYCPSCRGTGRVERFVPHEDVYPCSTCDGSGLAPK